MEGRTGGMDGWQTHLCSLDLVVVDAGDCL